MAEFWFLTGTTGKPRETFSLDGVATDLDSSGVPAVKVYRPDGTTITPDPTATHVSPSGSNPGAYEFPLDAQTDPTSLIARWTGNVGGLQQILTSRVEVIGGSAPTYGGEFLFNLSALRAVKVGGGTPFTDTTAYPTSLLLAKRIEVTTDFEQRCGWSFVPRYAREIHDDGG